MGMDAQRLRGAVHGGLGIEDFRAVAILRVRMLLHSANSLALHGDGGQDQRVSGAEHNDHRQDTDHFAPPRRAALFQQKRRDL